MKRHGVGRLGLLALSLALGLCLRPALYAQPAPGAQINFSFDQADLRLVVKLVGEMTGQRFVMDDTLQGVVTVMTPSQIPVEQALDFLSAILDSRGYAMVERQGVYHIVALPASEVAAGSVLSGDAELPPRGLVTRILRLNHVSAVDVRKMLEPMVRGGKAGALSAFGPTNHLMITDTVENLQRIERIIEELDRPGSSTAIEVVTLKHASADELARQLQAAIVGAETSGRKLSRHMQQIAEGGAALPSESIVVPVSHANQLLLIGTPVQLSELKNLVELLDVESSSGYGRLNVIFLKYLSAEDAAKSLNALLLKGSEKEERAVVSVEPSVPNNALLVDASPRDFERVQELITRLDLPPQQVMVEILIAEITMGKNLDLGVEWSTIDAPKEGETTVVGRSRPGPDSTLDNILDGSFPEGLALGVARGTYVDAQGLVLPRIPFLLRAMASDRDVKILSNIPLWAQNNMEASIRVVDNIPILRSTIEGGAGTARDVIQNIERMDVGIQLKVTPYVNPDQEVRLILNPIIEAIVDQGPAEALFAPTIARREVSTTVTVPNKATVVISGLIREDRVKSVSKVPFLGDIPILGHLFRRTVDRTQRTNLLIFVTPHIVTDLQEAIRLRDTLEEKTTIDRSQAELTPSESEP